MLSIYVARPSGLQRTDLRAGEALPPDTLWIDLKDPTSEEERQVESALGIDIPTRDEMREIEASNRFYEENGALYATATIVTKLDTDLPESTQVTFILCGPMLITNRYADPLPFRRFIAYSANHPALCTSAAITLGGLLEAIVNRIADVLEKVGSEVDSLSSEIFSRSYAPRTAPLDFRRVLERIGQCGELVSKARESLVSLARLLGFVQQSANSQVPHDATARYREISRDVNAMSDHASFLGDKVQFVLDATLGMVSIDQNNILKIFSVVTVVLLPPSVITGFFGMNFEHMPWLHERWGLLAAAATMVASAVIPYALFRRRGWL
ncbi:MAG TPA: magnesium transporter CorA family protein [Steroidobacteraceae bacterium]|nr:magnesium transporter CorA family protein [Steroidobacteraceae bacterium]